MANPKTDQIDSPEVEMLTIQQAAEYLRISQEKLLKRLRENSVVPIYLYASDSLWLGKSDLEKVDF